MCSGGENPGGMTTSVRLKPPPVLAPVALIVSRPRRNQVASPSPGSRTTACWLCSLLFTFYFSIVLDANCIGVKLIHDGIVSRCRCQGVVGEKRRDERHRA